MCAAMPIFIFIDVAGRQIFDISLLGIMEIEIQCLVLMIFAAMPYVTVTMAHIVIDLFFAKFSARTKQRLEVLTASLSMVTAALLSWLSCMVALEAKGYTATFHLPEAFFFAFVSASLGGVALGFAFQLIRHAIALIKSKDVAGLAAMLGLALLVYSLPFLYKASGISLSKLTIGVLGFVLLFILLFLRASIGMTMALVGTLGLFCTLRTVENAFTLVGEVPYRETSNFILVAVPMFMLMGEVMSVTGISKTMFDCFYKWLGRLPGGLACASVAGCAGFGAICGESLPTVIAMTSVALPEMRSKGYDPALSAGALAAGGTLGILIPPSMGFVWYSIMTEESVGTLFIAGIMPGLLLTFLFIMVIFLWVRKNPALAPLGVKFSWSEKIRALIGLIPVGVIFLLVVGGILGGFFTPGEGGAIGSVGGVLLGISRRSLSKEGVIHALSSTANMTGKVFILLVGVYVLSTFFASSRVPALLAEFVASLDMNKFIILGVVILVYIVLGCCMNITPMMLLTLPTIYPTIETLGFDGIWFGVITVILMECGQITPPIGLNVFTLASLAPDIPMATIFRGVMPFFGAMLVCIALIIFFPQIALWLPNTLMN